MGGLRQRPFAIAVLATLTCVVIALAVIQVTRYTRYGDLQYWARNIELGRPVQSQTLSALAPEASLLVGEGECQASFVKAGLTLLLSDLDNLDPDLEYQAWSETLQRAEEFALHALTCLPTNGNFWLRLAMIEKAIAERPGEIARLITFSQLYSPAEEKVLSGRYLLYNRLTTETLDLLSGPLRQDLQVICSSVGDNLRKTLPPAGPALASVIPRIVPGCPQIGASQT